jgi:hypothetical protein
VPQPLRLAALALLGAVLLAEAGAACEPLGGEAPPAGAMAVIPGTARAWFHRPAPGCPEGGEACRGRAYLLAGDAVLVGERRGGWICATYADARGRITWGWLRGAELAPLPPTTAPAGDWAGTWRFGPEQTLRLAPAKGGAVAVDGEASWGAADPGRVARGAVHVGELRGVATPQGGRLAFTMGGEGRTLPYEAGDAYACRVWMERHGPYLVVADQPGNCGGLNVRFSGLYRRD